MNFKYSIWKTFCSRKILFNFSFFAANNDGQLERDPLGAENMENETQRVSQDLEKVTLENVGFVPGVDPEDLGLLDSSHSGSSSSSSSSGSSSSSENDEVSRPASTGFESYNPEQIPMDYNEITEAPKSLLNNEGNLHVFDQRHPDLIYKTRMATYRLKIVVELNQFHDLYNEDQKPKLLPTTLRIPAYVLDIMDPWWNLKQFYTTIVADASKRLKEVHPIKLWEHYNHPYRLSFKAAHYKDTKGRWQKVVEDDMRASAPQVMIRNNPKVLNSDPNQPHEMGLVLNYNVHIKDTKWNEPAIVCEDNKLLKPIIRSILQNDDPIQAVAVATRTYANTKKAYERIKPKWLEFDSSRVPVFEINKSCGMWDTLCEVSNEKAVKEHIKRCKEKAELKSQHEPWNVTKSKPRNPESWSTIDEEEESNQYDPTSVKQLFRIQDEIVAKTKKKLSKKMNKSKQRLFSESSDDETEKAVSSQKTHKLDKKVPSKPMDTSVPKTDEKTINSKQVPNKSKDESEIDVYSDTFDQIEKRRIKKKIRERSKRISRREELKRLRLQAIELQKQNSDVTSKPKDSDENKSKNSEVEAPAKEAQEQKALTYLEHKKRKRGELSSVDEGETLKKFKSLKSMGSNAKRNQNTNSFRNWAAGRGGRGGQRPQHRFYEDDEVYYDGPKYVPQTRHYGQARGRGNRGNRGSTRNSTEGNRNVY